MTEQEFKKDLEQKLNITKGDLLDVVSTIFCTHLNVDMNDIENVRGSLYGDVTHVLKMLEITKIEVKTNYKC